MGVVTSRYDIPNRFVTSPVKTRKDFYFFLPICERQKKIQTDTRNIRATGHVKKNKTDNDLSYIVCTIYDL